MSKKFVRDIVPSGFVCLGNFITLYFIGRPKFIRFEQAYCLMILLPHLYKTYNLFIQFVVQEAT